MVFPPVLSLPVGGEGTIGKRWSQRKTDTVFLWGCSVSSLCVWKLAGNWATIHPFFFYLYLSSFSNYRPLYPSFSLLLCLFWLPPLLSPLPTFQLHYPHFAVCQAAGWYFTPQHKHWNTFLLAGHECDPHFLYRETVSYIAASSELPLTNNRDMMLQR